MDLSKALEVEGIKVWAFSRLVDLIIAGHADRAYRLTVELAHFAQRNRS